MKLAATATILWLAFALTCLAAWVTHIIYTIQHHEYLLLIAGALIAPVGTIHGFGIWFGFWR